MTQPRFPYKTQYGHFSEDGASYIITRPDTPRPWINVISTGTYGVALSQAGGGYSWMNHASLNRITRWNQDLIQDNVGRFIYLRDDKSGKFWSAAWQPVKQNPDHYEVIHGVGHTIYNARYEGIQTQWLVFVPEGETHEVWRLRIRNTSKTERRLSLWTYLEWNLGEAPDWHREFHRSFIETSFHDHKKIIVAKKRLSPLKNAKGQPWNRTWDHVAWHAVNVTPRDASGDKQAFLGNYGSPSAPAAVKEGRYVGPTTHKWDDGIGSVHLKIDLKAGEERSVLFTLGVADDTNAALAKARTFMDFSAVDNAWGRTEMFWDNYLRAFPVETPDKGFNALTNTWLKYQALSGRLWGRTAFYQMGGAYGFRDQLQDSQTFLPLEASATLKQIRLHAEHQFSDGTVYHWWHPLSEEGHPSNYSDDLLWLPFVLMNYLKETGNWEALREVIPFAKRPGSTSVAGSGTLYDHAKRAIEKALTRLSPRGLPLIGEADWNDGLSAVGWDGKGESVWMAHFLYGLLSDWAVVVEKAVAAKVVTGAEKPRSARYRKAAERLKKSVNKHGWDGAWYWGATTDAGAVLGSHKNKEGQIFLNCQTWAIINGVVDDARKKAALLKSLEKHLYGPHGPLLLTPPYTTPDESVGYLTRYSPTTRENGGVYFHAAVWALQMECQLGRSKKAWELYTRMSPILRSAADPELYRCEPYVTPGNVDGPGSPTPGRGGWTWYTGSAAWLYRVSTEGFLGIRPTWEGLTIRPCFPPDWKEAKATRTFRGTRFNIRYARVKNLPAGAQKLVVNGRPFVGDTLPATSDPAVDVLVQVGPAK